MDSSSISDEASVPSALPIAGNLIERWREDADSASDQHKGIVSRISDSCIDCLRDILQHAAPECITKSSAGTLRKCYAMLNLWADGHGVGDGRLDNLLERSTELREVTFEVILPLLKAVLQAVAEFVVPRTSDVTILRRHAVALELYVQTKWLVLNDDDSDGDSDGDSESEAQSDDAHSESKAAGQMMRAKSMVGKIETYTNCLMAMGSALDCPAPDDEHVDKTGQLSGEQRCASDYHADLIKAKFPQADVLLVHQLGKASWERYQRMQQERELNTNKGIVPTTSNKSHANLSEFQDSGLGTSLAPPVSYYASTIVSARSLMSSITGARGTNLPSLSSEARSGALFDCSACGKSIRAVTNREWRKHLYADLRPYSFTFANCNFSTGPFLNRQAWGEHLGRDHNLGPAWEATKCPLCLEMTDGGRGPIILHLSQHMEEIALLAIPRDVDSDAESESGSSEGADVQNLRAHDYDSPSLSPQNNGINDHSEVVENFNHMSEPGTNTAAISEHHLVEHPQPPTSHEQGDTASTEFLTENQKLEQHIPEVQDRTIDEVGQKFKSTFDEIAGPIQTQGKATNQAVRSLSGAIHSGNVLGTNEFIPLQDGPCCNDPDCTRCRLLTSEESAAIASFFGEPVEFPTTEIEDIIIGSKISDGDFLCVVPSCKNLRFSCEADLNSHFHHHHKGGNAYPGSAESAIATSSTTFHNTSYSRYKGATRTSHLAPDERSPYASLPQPSQSHPISTSAPTETSVSTDLVSQLPGVPLLEDNDGVLELSRDHMPTTTPVFECVFWFLNCGNISRNQEEWTTHCESHFHGEEPPQTAQCPLCDWTITSSRGWDSWAARMQHLACNHLMLGQMLRMSRPDLNLFHHLWQRRLIDDQDYKELLGGYHTLPQPPADYVQTNGRVRRREREERRHRKLIGDRDSKELSGVHGQDSNTEDGTMLQKPVGQTADLEPCKSSTIKVGEISKVPYVRPQHPKLMCQYCQERPDGFRGTHELDRHVARAHAATRKGYICIDNSPDKKFLASCKFCLNKKVYGAYYNAAAHLRRAHFHPRKRGRNGKKEEKRGGLRGGDDPPMEALRQYWIQEIEVPNVTPSVPNEEFDISDSETDVLYKLDEEEPQSAWLNQVPTWESTEGLHAGIGHSEPLRVLESSEEAKLGRKDISPGVFTF